jgi:hypothetical protein
MTDENILREGFELEILDQVDSGILDRFSWLGLFVLEIEST